MVADIDEGFEFLGFRIQPKMKRGSHKAFVYTLAVEEIAVLDHGQGEDHMAAGNEQPAVRSAAPTQQRFTGMDELLPAWRVQRHPPIPDPIRLGAGCAMATAQTASAQLGVATEALPGHQVVTRARMGGPVPVWNVAGDPIRLPRHSDPFEMGDDQQCRIADGVNMVESRTRWKSHVGNRCLDRCAEGATSDPSAIGAARAIRCIGSTSCS
jgi:hypothetical protein